MKKNNYVFVNAKKSSFVTLEVQFLYVCMQTFKNIAVHDSIVNLNFCQLLRVGAIFN